MKYLLLFLLLTGCAHPEHRLALVFSVDPIPHEQLLRQRGYDVKHMPLPCDGDLRCWAKNPQWLAQYVEDTHAMLLNEHDVLLVGVSRGGYLALRMAGFSEVSQVMVLSPVTDLTQLSEYKGYDAPALDPSLLRGKRTFLQIGNADDRVGTLAAMHYAEAAMNPTLTMVVSEGEGHTLPDASEAMTWLDGEEK